MRKLFSIFSIVLLYVTIAFGQAQADFEILVHDALNANYPLWFGLDLTATDGIDFTLGESDLPPPPPGNAFDARWWLPPFLGALSSWRDYRAPGNPPAFPFTGQKEHNLKFQSTDYPITIRWNLPSTIASTSVIRDMFGGVLINKSFSGNDSLVVTNTAIGQLQVLINYVDVVPVELTSFTAQVSEKGVLLNWTTATELNNQGFNVERKTIGWETIGYVPGYGTTTEPKSYSFLDNEVTTGTYTYRLKQIDFDGTISYSNEIEVVVNFTPGNFELFQNYPNPFNPTTTIKFSIAQDAKVSLVVYDMLGQKVRTLVDNVQEAGYYSVRWDGTNDFGSKVSSGIYIYRLQAGNFVQTMKMNLMK